LFYRFDLFCRFVRRRPIGFQNAVYGIILFDVKKNFA